MTRTDRRGRPIVKAEPATTRAEEITEILKAPAQPTDHAAVRAYVHRLADAGLAVMFISPGSKVPFDGRTVRQRQADDKVAQKAAQAAGRKNWAKVKSPAGLALATTDTDVLDGYFTHYATVFPDRPVSLAVVAGPSRIVVVDCDTDDETAAFRTDDGSEAVQTVTSPGSQDSESNWVHEPGNGHFWFTVPDDVELPGNAASYTDPEGRYAVKWGDSYVLIPPSSRKEGSYTATGPVRELPTWLRDRITQKAGTQPRVASRTTVSGESTPVDEWSRSVGWDETLIPWGWTATTLLDRCGCPIWTAPGVHDSPKSATAHEPGCAEPKYDTDNPPLHIWTDNPGEPFASNVDVSGVMRKTLSKLQTVALFDFDNKVGDAMEAYGLHAEPVTLPGKTDGVKSASARTKDPTSEDGRPRLWRPADMKPAQPLQWLAKGNIPKSAATLLVGDEGIGKSTFWVWLVAHVTTGKPCPEFGLPARDPQEVILVLTEDDWSSAVLPRLTVAGAGMDLIRVCSVDNDGSGAPTFPDHLEAITDEENPPALVVVDAWLDTVPAGTKASDPQQARQVLQPWKDFTARYENSVLLLSHTNRQQTGDARQKYGVTSELRKAVRMALFAQADPEDEGSMLVGPEKGNNVASGSEATRFRIVPVQHFAATDDSDGIVTKMECLGPVGKSSRELIVEAFHRGIGDDDMEDVQDKITEAIRWLEDFLTIQGKTSKKKVADEARAVGIKVRTLERAAKKIGVKSEAAGFPATTHWELTGGVQMSRDMGAGGS